ncbi:Tubulin/FtsZ family, GTPase domain-containing protein [Obelidium mucronatum]|nr:Tubulin/FtsZ family, GTPase domain-containing protein [Obelidium mucronatum]
MAKHSRRCRLFTVKETNRNAGSTGRGNNWAHGYSDDFGTESTLEVIRQTIEKQSSSYSQGTILFQSIAGGTGSGLGSRLTEDIRDEFPKRFLWNCAIAPFASGETALQHYNSLLSLAKLQQNSDLISVFSNDVVMNVLTKQHALYRGNKTDPKISLSELNNQIASSMAGVLLPTSPVTRTDTGDLNHLPMRGFNGWDLITQVAPMPSCKLVSISTSTNALEVDKRMGLLKGLIPASSWEDVTSDLFRNLPPIPLNMKKSHISSWLYARNAVGPEFWDRQADKMQSKVKQKLGPSIVPPPAQALELVASSSYAMNIKSTARSLTLVSNNSDAISNLSHLLQRSHAMYESGAYLHWYDRHFQQHHSASRPIKKPLKPQKKKTGGGWDNSIHDPTTARGGLSGISGTVFDCDDDNEPDPFPWPYTKRIGRKMWMESDWDVSQLFEEGFEVVETMLDSYNTFCTNL